MVTMVFFTLSGIVAAIIFNKKNPFDFKKDGRRAIVLFFTALGLLIGFMVAIVIEAWMPKEYVLIKQERLLPAVDNHFVFKIDTDHGEKYMFKKMINGEPKIDRVAVDNTEIYSDLSMPEIRKEAVLKTYKNQSKLYRLFCAFPDYHYKIRLPQGSKILD